MLDHRQGTSRCRSANGQQGVGQAEAMGRHRGGPMAVPRTRVGARVMHADITLSV